MKRLPPTPCVFLRKLYIDQGKSGVQIAEMLHYSYGTVYDHLKKCGIARRKVAEMNRFGKNNPNWKGSTIQHVCLECGNLFYGRKARQFCCLYCANQYRVGKHNLSLQEDISCLECGQSFSAYKSCSRVFCSPECAVHWKTLPDSERIYPAKFDSQLRALVRERDGHICQICGMPESGRNQELSVHHINYQKNDSRKENLISLCASCHSKTNSHRDCWQAFLEAKIKDFYAIPLALSLRQ